MSLVEDGHVIIFNLQPSPNRIPQTVKLANQIGTIRSLQENSNGTCDMVAETSVNTGFAFVFANIAVSKSRHRLFFYPS